MTEFDKKSFPKCDRLSIIKIVKKKIKCKNENRPINIIISFRTFIHYICDRSKKKRPLRKSSEKFDSDTCTNYEILRRLTRTNREPADIDNF